MNGDEVRKKVRSANFSKCELQILSKLLTKYASIIECKKSDAVTWRQKLDTWKKLGCEFNKECNGPPRTYITLKSKYEQMKKDVRKKVAGNKQQLFKTGGGTPQISPLTTVEETIYNLILVSVEGLPPRYDDDDDDSDYYLIFIDYSKYFFTTF